MDYNYVKHLEEYWERLEEHLDYFFFFFFKEIHVLLFIYLFIYDCVESSFLCEGFL